MVPDAVSSMYLLMITADERLRRYRRSGQPKRYTLDSITIYNNTISGAELRRSHSHTLE